MHGKEDWEKDGGILEVERVGVEVHHGEGWRVDAVRIPGGDKLREDGKEYSLRFSKGALKGFRVSLAGLGYHLFAH